jgi:hypothetical protein
MLYIHGTNSIRMCSVTTFFTYEGQTIAIVSADVVTSRASLGGISRIDIDYGYSGFICLVFDKPLQLPESPTTMLISKFFGTIRPFSNMSQVFHTDH